MWAYGNHFHSEDVNDQHVTLEYEMEVKFNQTSRISQHDQNLLKEKLGYVRNIEKIIQLDISYVQCIIFRCKWWDILDHSNVKEYCDSGLIYINSKNMWDKKEPYVFPKHYKQVFFT